MIGLDLKAAHKHCTSNRSALAESERAGCFYCCKMFSPSEIEDWVEDKGRDTAICPKCGIDSVLGDASGLPIQDPKFLSAMRRHWFDKTHKFH